MNNLKLENMNSLKTIKKISLMVLCGVSLMACSSDDDIPEVINQEELITTVKITLVPENNGETVELSYQDLDGDGSNEAVIKTEALQANTVYAGTIQLLNETVDPIEDITLEVAEEGDEHQFFYSNEANLTVSYTDEDANGNPIGITFLLETSTAKNGSLTVVLRHEPNKNAPGVSDGNIENAGGETDIHASFPITVE